MWNLSIIKCLMLLRPRRPWRRLHYTCTLSPQNSPEIQIFRNIFCRLHILSIAVFKRAMEVFSHNLCKFQKRSLILYPSSPLRVYSKEIDEVCPENFGSWLQRLRFRTPKKIYVKMHYLYERIISEYVCLISGLHQPQATELVVVIWIVGIAIDCRFIF